MRLRRTVTNLLAASIVLGGLNTVGVTAAVAANPPPPVSRARAAAVTTTSTTLQWVNPKASTFRGVSIRRHDGEWSADGSTFRVATSGPVDQWTDTGLTPGSTYSYGLYASHTSGFAAVTVVTVTVPIAPSLTGTVTATTGGAPLGKVTVTATNNDGRVDGTAVTAADGTYAISGLPAGGRYRLCFSPALLDRTLTTGNGYLATCRGGATLADAVRVTAPASKLDVTLDGASSITGAVRRQNDDGSAGASLEGVTVVLGDDKSDPVAYTTTGKFGVYRFAGLAAGQYTVCVNPLRSAYADTAGGMCWLQEQLYFPPNRVSVKAATAVASVDFKLFGADNRPREDYNAASTSDLNRESCADAFFLAARGSGESGTGGVKAIYQEKNLAVGGPVLTAYQQLKSKLTAGGLSVTRPVTVAYRADDTQPDIGNTDYVGNLWAGVREARRALVERASQCPGETLVLAGYGQGASLMRRLLTNATTAGVAALDPAILARVQATVLLGDSDRVAGDPVMRFGNADPDSQGVLTELDKTSAGTPVSTGTGLGVFDVCVEGDLLCDSHVPYGCTADTLATCGLYQSAYADGERVNLTSYAGAAITTAAADAAAARVLRAPHIKGSTSLPDGTVGSPYSYTLTTTDGRAGTWQVGTGLPSGLSLQGSTITGTPDRNEYAKFTVTFTDTQQRRASKPLTIFVRPASGGVGTATRLPTSATATHIWAARNGDYLVAYHVTEKNVDYVQWNTPKGPRGPVLQLPTTLSTRAVVDEQNTAYFGLDATPGTGGSLVAFADGASSAYVRKTFSESIGASSYRTPTDIVYYSQYVYVAADSSNGCANARLYRFSRAGLLLAQNAGQCNGKLGAGGGYVTVSSGNDANYLNAKTLEYEAKYFTDDGYAGPAARGPTGDFAISTTYPLSPHGDEFAPTTIYRVTADSGVVQEVKVPAVLGETDPSYDDYLSTITFTSDNTIVITGETSTGRKMAFLRPDGTVSRRDYNPGLGPVPDGDGHVLVTRVAPCPASATTCDGVVTDRYDADSVERVYTRGGSRTVNSKPTGEAVGSGSLGLIVNDADPDDDGITLETVRTQRIVVATVAGLRPPAWPQV